MSYVCRKVGSLITNAPLFLLNASMLLFFAGIAAFRALFSSGVSFLLLLTLFRLVSCVASISLYVLFSNSLILDLVCEAPAPCVYLEHVIIM